MRIYFGKTAIPPFCEKGSLELEGTFRLVRVSDFGASFRRGTNENLEQPHQRGHL